MDPCMAISKRMQGVVTALLPKIESAVSARNPNNIDLATAENWLIRPEVISIYKETVQQHLLPQVLSYPQGFGGDPDLLEALAKFFNAYFKPSLSVLPTQIVATPGATNCLDALLTSICDEGDSVLIPAPFWSGFNFHFKVRPKVNIIPVRLSFPDNVHQQFTWTEKNTSPCDLVTELTRAYNDSPEPNRVKALVLTNPHNPFGICYSAEVLQSCIDFCSERNIHYISDEVYALSVSSAAKDAGEVGFTSALSLASVNECSAQASNVVTKDLANDGRNEDLGKEATATMSENTRDRKIHVIWSISKDLGCSGPKLAALVSQSPGSTSVRASVSILSNLHLSTLAALTTTHLLNSDRFHDLVLLSNSRLEEQREIVCAQLQNWKVPFLRPSGGPFVFGRLGRNCTNLAEEEQMVRHLRASGVLVTPGSDFGVRGYWGKECDVAGWVRITVAVPTAKLREGLAIIGRVLEFST